MPWTKDNLPDQVKSLPKDASSIWLSAVNSVIGQGKKDEEAVKIGWSAVKKAGWKKGEDNKWKKGKFYENFEFDAEIFSVGNWNGDRFFSYDLDNMVYNFNSLKNEIKPFLKLGHNTQQERDGQPSLGWIEGLRREGGKLIASFKDVPKIIYEAIKSKRYKRISAEIYFNYKDLSGNLRKKVLRAASLLGADVPEVKNLQDIIVFLSQQDESLFDQVKEYQFDSKGDFVESKLITLNEGSQKKMDANEKKKFQEDLDKKEKALKVEKEEREKAEAELKKFKEEKAEELEEKIKGDFKSFCEEQVKANIMNPAQRDKLIEGVVYSEEKILVPFDLFKSFCEDKKSSLNKGEYGEENENENEEYGEAVNISMLVDQKAIKFMEKDSNLTYDQAVDRVLEKNPKLADKYLKG